MEHLVYCDAKSNVLHKLLDGTKTMIIRGAAGRKHPHSRVFENETLYFIENNGDGLMKAKGKVKRVFNSEKMTEDDSKKLVDENSEALNLSPTQYERWAGKKVLCLIEVENIELIEPLEFDRQKNMDDWITVEKIEDIVAGTSQKFTNIRINDKK